MASFLTLEATPTQTITSIKDVLTHNALVCYTTESTGYISKLTKKYPNMHSKLINTKGADLPSARSNDLLAAIRTKKNGCEVGILPSKVR